MSQMTTPWKNLPPMMTKQSMCTAAILRGKLFVTGGWGDSTEFYDVHEGRSTKVTARMRERHLGCAAASIGKSVYVAGGQVMGGGDDVFGSPSDSAEAFDVDSGLWRTLPSMRTKREHCAAVSVGDDFMVFGGQGNSFRCLNTAESFNVGTGRWQDLPPMNTGRWGCAAAVIGDKVYVIGGQGETHRSDTVDVFNITTRRWTLLPHRMTTPRYGCAAAAMGNYLVVAGGCDDTHRLSTVEMYDVDAETWTILPSMTTKREGCAAVSLGGSIFVVGGMGKNWRNLDSVEEIQFSDDIVKGMLVEWREGSWRDEVAPILHRRTSVVHTLDVDVTLMPTLLSRMGEEERVQTVFEMVRGKMGVFEHTCWMPNKKQKRC